jgi:hypothetical protein
MMGHSTLKLHFKGDNIGKSKNLKYSLKYRLWSLTFTSRKVTFGFNDVKGTLGKMSMMSLAIISMISFKMDKMM